MPRSKRVVISLNGGEPVPPNTQVLETLLVMIENRGRVLTKDELLNLVWGDTIVEEGLGTRLGSQRER